MKTYLEPNEQSRATLSAAHFHSFFGVVDSFLPSQNPTRFKIGTDYRYFHFANIDLM